MTTEDLQKHGALKIGQYEKEYGSWSGNPRGNRPIYDRCAFSVWDKGAYYPHQCQKPCGHGKHGAYCKTHAQKIAKP
jgi:hypothetical protein